MKTEEDKELMEEVVAYYAAVSHMKTDTDENQIFIRKKSEDYGRAGYVSPEGSMAICLQPKNTDDNLRKASKEDIKELCGFPENRRFILEFYMDMLEKETF